MWIMWKENKFNKVLVRKHDMPKVLWFAKVKPPDNFSKQSSGLEQILARFQLHIIWTDYSTCYIIIKNPNDYGNCKYYYSSNEELLIQTKRYKIPQIVNPTIHAILPKLTQRSFTAPVEYSCEKGRIAIEDGTWDRYQLQILLQIYTV